VNTMLRDIRLIIYDLDGVLIDSREAIVETFNRVLDELGADRYPAEAIKEMIGEPLIDMYMRALPQSMHHLIPHCYERYVAIYRELAPGSVSLLPGVEETLTHFRALSLRQSIATTKRSDVAAYILRRLDVAHLLDLVLGVNDVESPKPSPEIIELTLQRLMVERGAAVFIEDTTIGLEAGRGAGVHTVAVTTGTHSRERLLSASPDYVIDDIRGLKAIIGVAEETQ